MRWPPNCLIPARHPDSIDRRNEPNAQRALGETLKLKSDSGRSAEARQVLGTLQFSHLSFTSERNVDSGYR
jgi:hypothetical protein